VLVNGGFGIGRTTVARLLRARLAGSAMAFSNLAYLRERTAGVARFDARVRHFCLTAPFPVVRARLEERGLDPASSAGAWQLRRAAECCAAHRAPEFAEQLPTEDMSPTDVAAAIAARLAEG